MRRVSAEIMRADCELTTSPATAVESTPVAPRYSGRKYAANGVMSETVVSRRASSRCPRTQSVPHPTTKPHSAPPASTAAKYSPACENEKAPVAAARTA